MQFCFILKSKYLIKILMISILLFIFNSQIIAENIQNQFIGSKNDKKEENSKKDKEYPIEILNEEANYYYSKSGVKRYTYHRKYKILTQKGAEGWNSVSASWHEWYQKKPVIKARVISPDGKISKLDPTTLGEVSDKQESNLIYSDKKIIKGPLPAIKVGCIVEEEYLYQDKIPYFKAGSQQWYRFDYQLPIKRTRLKIDLPIDSYFKYSLHNSDLKPDIKKRDGRKTYSFEFNDLKEKPSPPKNMVPGHMYWMSIEFSTIKSWEDVSKTYFNYIKDQMKTSSMTKELLKNIKIDKSNKRASIDKLVKIMHKNVRYTGLEFGESAIKPFTPDEVLKRKYGDCKDKSVLLVSLLKDIGIKANVALLHAGYGSDVSADIPGMEFFNHAIVYIPEPYNIWIDPTAEFIPVGDLPLADCERYALIVDPKMGKLVRTPVKRSEENKINLTRKVYLPQLGKSKINEVYTTTGVTSSRIKAYYNKQGTKKIAELFNEYVKKEFNSDKIKDLKYTQPSDMKHDFSYSFTIGDSNYGYTNIDEASVLIDLSSLLREFPEGLVNFKNINLNKDDDYPKWKDRKVDFLLRKPHINKVSYQIYIPPGFNIIKFPENEEHKVGKTILRKSYKLQKNILYTDYEINTGRGKYTPAQIKELRKMLYNIYANDTIEISLVSIGSRLSELGKIDQCVKKYSILITKYPSEVGNYIRLGNTLLKAGFRDAAINYFDKAIKLNAKSVEAYMALGWAYLHDPFGRQLVGDVKINKAIDVYSNVTKIDDSIANAWRNLAILYEYDPDCNRYSPEAEFNKSIKYYEYYRDKFKRDDLNYNYLLTLFYNGNYDKILKLKKMTKNNNNLQTLYLSALAVKKGLKIVWDQLDSFSTNKDDREKIINAIANNLGNARKYKLSSKLLMQLSRFSSDAVELQSRANYLSKAKRWKAVQINDDKPESVIYKFLKMTYIDEANKESINNIYSSLSLSVWDIGNIEKKLKRKKRDLIRLISDQGKVYESVLDLIFSNIRFNVSGDDLSGYKVKVSIDLWNRNVNQIYYVVKEENKYKLLDTDDEFPTVIGVLALFHYNNKNYKNASIVLDWLARKSNSFTDKFQGHPFYHVWEKSSKDKDKIKLASLVLLSNYKEYTNKLLKFQGMTSNEDYLIQIDRSLIKSYYRKKDYKNALKYTKKIVEKNKDASKLLRLYYGLLSKNNQVDNLEDYINGLLNDDPDNIETIVVCALMKIKQGKMREAKQLLQDAHDNNIANAQCYNLIAWLGLFLNSSLDELLDYSIKSNRLSKFKEHAYLHTLATIYAEMEKISEAKQVVFKILENINEKNISESDHYILGRNAETLNLFDVALMHYKKIKPSKEINRISVYELALNRMKILEKRNR